MKLFGKKLFSWNYKDVDLGYKIGVNSKGSLYIMFKSRLYLFIKE